MRSEYVAVVAIALLVLLLLWPTGLVVLAGVGVALVSLAAILVTVHDGRRLKP